MFNLPRDLTITLVSGYSVVMRHRIMTRWQELGAMQQQPASRIPPTMSEALRLAADQLETIEQQQRQLIQQAAKVEFVDRYVDADGTVSSRELCKMLPANEGRVREFLVAEKIMYKSHGKLVPHKEHVLAGRFVVRAGQSDHGHAFTQPKFPTKGVTWITTEWAKYRMQQERLAA